MANICVINFGETVSYGTFEFINNIGFIKTSSFTLFPSPSQNLCTHSHKLIIMHRSSTSHFLLLLPSTYNSLLLLVLFKSETRNGSIVSYLMMANGIAESARIETFGGLLHLFHPDTRKMARQLERINEKLVRHELSVQFNKTCIYISIYLSIYIKLLFIHSI